MIYENQTEVDAALAHFKKVGQAFEEAFNCRRTVASWLPAEERTPEKQAEILADLAASCEVLR